MSSRPRIREIAGEHHVPIFEAPPLARVLYRNVDIGQEIPSNVYVAVAQVLTLRVPAEGAKRGRSRRSRISASKVALVRDGGR